MLAQIHNMYPSMTDTEKSIADVIISDPYSVTRMQTKQLAEKSGTVASAVTRFCYTLGVDSFNELKLLLAEEIARLSSASEFSTKLSANDNTYEVLSKVFKSGIRTLKETLSKIDVEEMEKIAGHLVNANRILCFGATTSGVIAENANNRFSQMGLNSTCCTDYMFMGTFASRLKPGDVSFAVSSSGSTKIIVDTQRLAKQAGATTVAITVFSESLLAKESDYTIIVYGDEQNFPIESISSRVAQLCITDALVLMLVAKAGDNMMEQLRDGNDTWEGFYYK